MKRAFTLIEVMVVVTIVLILVACLFPVLNGASCSPGDNGLSNFNQYLSSKYSNSKYTVKSSSCINRDIDGDQYVSCTAAVEDKEGNITSDNMECSVYPDQGCRAPQGSVINRW